MIDFIVKGSGLIKINIMCKLYMFLFSSLSQGTHHCASHATIVPWYCPDFRTVGYVTVLYCFRMFFSFGLDFFNKHVEKDYLQHGLGTPYSNSACFDKDDLWNFCSFLYSACPRHYFSPSPSIDLYDKLVLLGLPRPVIEVLTNIPPPKSWFILGFWEKKKT